MREHVTEAVLVALFVGVLFGYVWGSNIRATAVYEQGWVDGAKTVAEQVAEAQR